MTEASHQITANPLPPAPHYPGSVGTPGGSVEVRILSTSSEDEDPVADGGDGEICIRSLSVTNGYLFNSSANASSFTPQHHLFRTGDYGKFVTHDEGRYLYLTGRIKEFINKGGEKISPVEVDNVIAQHPSAQDVATFAIEDEMYGQDVGCAIVLTEGERLGARDMQKWVRSRIAPSKVPRKISAFVGRRAYLILLIFEADLVPKGDSKDDDGEDTEERSCRDDVEKEAKR